MPAPFYNAAVRRVVAAFGAMFDGIAIERKDALGAVVKTINVPVTYAPKTRFYQMLEYSENDGETPVNVVFPRLAYELTSMYYDSTRKLNTINKVVKEASDGESRSFVYSPVPYNLTFSLYIGAKNTDDALNIVEQIIPYFTPHFTISIYELDSPQVSRDVPFTLQSTDFSDTYDGDPKQDRTIIWTMNFVAAAYVYGPTHDAMRIMKTRIETFINDTTPVTVSTAEAVVDPVTSETTINTSVEYYPHIPDSTAP